MYAQQKGGVGTEATYITTLGWTKTALALVKMRANVTQQNFIMTKQKKIT